MSFSHEAHHAKVRSDQKYEEKKRWLDAKVAEVRQAPAPPVESTGITAAGTPRLSPVRHPSGDLFIADILDTSLKGDLASMEYPLFALKAGDKRIRTYSRNGVSVTVKPGFDGCATVHDKDVWIYCISQLVEAINRGREDVSRTVRFTAYNFLVTANRSTNGGKDGAYARMTEALQRLKGTTIETNIETAGLRDRQGFGLIDHWRVIEKSNGGRMEAVEVALPDWLFRSVRARSVLTLSRDYFRLRRPLDRRVYELARKHCGAQPRWAVSLTVLRDKSGSTASLPEFRRLVKALAGSNELPDYRVVFNAKADHVIFYSHGSKGESALATDLLKLGHQCSQAPQ